MKKIRVRWIIQAVCLLLVWLLKLFPHGGEWYATTIYPVCSSGLACFSSWFPFSLNDWFIYGSLAGILLYLIYAIWRKRRLKQALVHVAAYLVWVYIWFYAAWGLNYYRNDFYQRTQLERPVYSAGLFEHFLQLYTDSLNAAYCPVDTVEKDKVEAVLTALSNPRIEKTSDAFMEMVSYFQDQLSSEKTQLSIRIASVLLLDYLSEKEVPVSFDVSFDSLYRNLEESEIKEIFAAIDSTVLKKEFVDAVIDYDKAAAADTLVLIFPEYINSYIPTKLRRLNKGADYYALIKRSIESFRDSIPSFIFFSYASPLRAAPTNVSLSKMCRNPGRMLFAFSSHLSIMMSNLIDCSYPPRPSPPLPSRTRRSCPSQARRAPGFA